MKPILLLLAAWLLVFSVLLKWSKRKEAEKKVQAKRIKKEEWLIQLKDYAKYEIEGYENETKEQMEQLIEEKYALTEKIITTKLELPPELEQEVKQFIEKCNTFKEKHIKQIKHWEDLEKSYHEYIDYMRDFYDKKTYYPHEFVHDTNRVQRALEDLKEERRKNPLGSSKLFEEALEKAKTNVEQFEKYHKEITDLLDQQVLTEQDSDKKHQLYMALTQANYNEVEKQLNELKKRA